MLTDALSASLLGQETNALCLHQCLLLQGETLTQFRSRYHGVGVRHERVAEN